jgi:mRNA interferase YafQ
VAKLTQVLDALAQGEQLSAKHRDHALGGQWQGCRDCHIESDWVLIYRREPDRMVLLAIAMGSHAQLNLATSMPGRRTAPRLDQKPPTP